MTSDSSDPAPAASSAGDLERAAVTPLGRALPRVLVFGALLLLLGLAYVLDARTHLRPLGAVTFASVTVVVVVLTELAIAYVSRLGAAASGAAAKRAAVTGAARSDAPASSR